VVVTEVVVLIGRFLGIKFIFLGETALAEHIHGLTEKIQVIILDPPRLDKFKEMRQGDMKFRGQELVEDSQTIGDPGSIYRFEQLPELLVLDIMLFTIVDIVRTTVLAVLEKREFEHCC
jgi:hypothetical protein